MNPPACRGRGPIEVDGGRTIGGVGRRRDYLGWRIVWGLAATTTVNYGVLLYAFAVILPPMRRDLHASLAALSAGVSIAIAVSGLAAPAVGAWLDHHGARSLMALGSLLAAASVAGWSQARTLPELYLAFAGIGLSSAAVLYDAAFAVIAVWFVRDRNAALLTTTVVAGFASTIFLPLTQALTDALGWRDAVLVLACLCAVTAVPHAVIIRRAPADVGLAPDGVDPTTVVAPPPALHHVNPIAHLRDPMLRDALQLSSVRWLTASTFASWIGAGTVIVYLVSYLRAHGYTPHEAAIGAGAIGVLSVTGRIVLTSAARRLRLARVTASMVAGQVLGVVALAWLPRPVGLVLFVLAFGAGYGVMTIARAALLADYVPMQVFARVSGVQAMVVDIGRVAAPVAVGALITWTGGYAVMLAVVIACSAFAALALLVCDRSDIAADALAGAAT
jgi:MFS family permease